MTACVLDASVAAKWVLPAKGEPLAAEAVRLLETFTAGNIHFSVPDLFWTELGNILWKSVRLGRITGQAAADSIGWLDGLPIATSPTKPLIREAVTIAISFDRTVYDAAYLALAVVSGRSLITADERLVNAVGSRFPVRWLGSVA